MTDSIRVVYRGAQQALSLADGTLIRQGEPIDLPADLAATLLNRNDFEPSAPKRKPKPDPDTVDTDTTDDED